MEGSWLPELLMSRRGAGEGGNEALSKGRGIALDVGETVDVLA